MDSTTRYSIDQLVDEIEFKHSAIEARKGELADLEQKIAKRDGDSDLSDEESAKYLKITQHILLDLRQKKEKLQSEEDLLEQQIELKKQKYAQLCVDSKFLSSWESCTWPLFSTQDFIGAVKAFMAGRLPLDADVLGQNEDRNSKEPLDIQAAFAVVGESLVDDDDFKADNDRDI